MVVVHWYMPNLRVDRHKFPIKLTYIVYICVKQLEILYSSDMCLCASQLFAILINYGKHKVHNLEWFLFVISGS